MPFNLMFPLLANMSDLDLRLQIKIKTSFDFIYSCNIIFGRPCQVSFSLSLVDKWHQFGIVAVNPVMKFFAPG